LKLFQAYQILYLLNIGDFTNVRRTKTNFV